MLTRSISDLLHMHQWRLKLSSLHTSYFGFPFEGIEFILLSRPDELTKRLFLRALFTFSWILLRYIFPASSFDGYCLPAKFAYTFTTRVFSLKIFTLSFHTLLGKSTATWSCSICACLVGNMPSFEMWFYFLLITSVINKHFFLRLFFLIRDCCSLFSFT